MENQLPAIQQEPNEPIKLSRETAESIKLLIDSVAPYVERHMDAAREHVKAERAVTLEAARVEREQTIAAGKHGARLTFTMIALIITLTFSAAAGFAWFGQWNISEKLIIGMLGFAMGARATAR